MEAHHIIPVSIWWEDISENINYMDIRDHRNLHNEQNIPYEILRQYRKETNHLIIPCEYSLEKQKQLYLSFFRYARTRVRAQINSIIDQTCRYWRLAGNDMNPENYRGMSLHDWVIELIEQKKLFINNILSIKL